MGKLNTLKLRALSKPGARPGFHNDGNGLYLQVREPDRRSWVFRFKLQGQARLMGLGALRDVALAEARELAQAARKLVRQGIDPIEQRKGERGALPAPTFAEVANAYIVAHAAGWRSPRHGQQWKNTIATHVVPVFGNKSVAAIDVADVLRALQPIWVATPVIASRTRGRIEAVLDYAKVRGWRDGENPAHWRGHLDHLLPRPAKVHRVRHHPALPWQEIGLFMMQLGQKTGLAALALEFTILTAARAGEVLGARWSEIDLEAAAWTIPAERTKAAREHRVPLSAPAAALLHELQPLRSAMQSERVFPGRRVGAALSHSSLLALLHRMGRPDLTVHGFRSTFRDWCADSGKPADIAEAALAHMTGNAVERAYARSDLFERRRRLAEEWGAVCSHPATTAEVVPLRNIR